MPRNKVYKNREELIQAGIRMYRGMIQYKERIIAGDPDVDEEIYEKAEDYADKQLAKREEREAEKVDQQAVKAQNDAEYRESQEKTYRKNFVWEGANDEANLQHLLNLEVEIKRIKEELSDTHDSDLKLKLRRSLSDTTKEHRTLQEKLGIDRLSRAKAKESARTIDDWDRIKKEAKQKLDELAAEFADKAGKTKTEAELRDRMKYHFAIPFMAVDAVLSNHRRVLGLDMDVEKS